MSDVEEETDLHLSGLGIGSDGFPKSSWCWNLLTRNLPLFILIIKTATIKIVWQNLCNPMIIAFWLVHNSGKCKLGRFPSIWDLQKSLSNFILWPINYRWTSVVSLRWKKCYHAAALKATWTMFTIFCFHHIHTGFPLLFMPIAWIELDILLKCSVKTGRRSSFRRLFCLIYYWYFLQRKKFPSFLLWFFKKEKLHLDFWMRNS